MATVEANGVRHHYEEHGAGAPVLLLHGGWNRRRAGVRQTPVLAERHRVVLIDRRGHGRTPDVDGPITYEVMRDDTIACIEALDLAGAHLVGWSDGGIVALMVAIARPDLVGRIVAIGANASADAYTPSTGHARARLPARRPDARRLRAHDARRCRALAGRARQDPAPLVGGPLDFTDQLGRHRRAHPRARGRRRLHRAGALGRDVPAPSPRPARDHPGRVARGAARAARAGEPDDPRVPRRSRAAGRAHAPALPRPRPSDGCDRTRRERGENGDRDRA